MKKNQDQSATPATLRLKAEARLRERPGIRQSRVGAPATSADARRLLQELQVHQIELEMQNDELQKARDRMEALLEKYTDLYDFAPVGYLTLDHKGSIREVNLAGASLLGSTRSKLVNRRFGISIATEMRPDFTAFLRKAFENGTKQSCEMQLQQEGKPPRWVWIEACWALSGKECRLAVLDITARKQAEADRARLERQVHAASEREQRRIGQSLHEDLCQRLAGIELITTAMAMSLKAEARPESGRAGEIAGELHSCLQQALHFASVLQPVPVLEQGLVEAIDNLVHHLRGRSKILCNFEREDLPKIAIADATHLYRIAQEALGNAVQHAKASQIDISLSRRDRGLALIIADNGSGMAGPSGQGSGLGLQIMRYRSNLLGAALTIESKPGRGTVVACYYPVAGREQQLETGTPRNATRARTSWQSPLITNNRGPDFPGSWEADRTP